MAKKVFVIDDDEKILKLLELHLSKAGFKVRTQSEPVISDKEIKKFGPDLIVLDVMMPWLSGDALADIFDYSFQKRPKIIFYSIKPVEELRDLAASKGVEGFVSKAAGPEALVEKVRMTLAGK